MLLAHKNVVYPAKAWPILRSNSLMEIDHQQCKQMVIKVTPKKDRQWVVYSYTTSPLLLCDLGTVIASLFDWH